MIIAHHVNIDIHSHMFHYYNVSVGLVLLWQQESWPVCSVHSTAEQAPSEVRMWLHRWQIVWLANGDCSDYIAAALNRVAWKWYKIRAIAAIKELSSCQSRWHNKSDINKQVDKEQTLNIYSSLYMWFSTWILVYSSTRYTINHMTGSSHVLRWVLA